MYVEVLSAGCAGAPEPLIWLACPICGMRLDDVIRENATIHLRAEKASLQA